MSDGDMTGVVDSSFAIKDSGARQEFAGGMVRDTQEGKIDWLNLRFGPLYRRIAEHLTKGRLKYPDPELGIPNWTLARGREEALRAKQSAARHFEAWLNGETDEDHAAATPFNINLFEYLREIDPSIPPGFGTGAALTTAEPEREPAWTPSVGDRVRVVTDDQFNGNVGEVVHAPEYAVVSGWESWVKLPSGLLGFNKDELEPA